MGEVLGWVKAWRWRKGTYEALDKSNLNMAVIKKMSNETTLSEAKLALGTRLNEVENFV